jgi:hypothetical protein
MKKSERFNTDTRRINRLKTKIESLFKEDY